MVIIYGKYVWLERIDDIGNEVYNTIIDFGGDIMSTVKSTININKYYKEQLEDLVKQNVLTSLTEGINLAIEKFVNEKQKEVYNKQMQEAAQDADFMKRTLSSQLDFEKIDIEVNGEW
ncbi:MAG TPA: hypothetical protein DEP23_14155 [Ruminococcaceae bacterium]|jgi:hypothetical protein|nr:hypothetical protein [Oscillospiraceae bacterium]